MAALIGIGSLVLVAAVLLGTAELMNRLFPRIFQSRVWTALHLLAFLATVGTGLLVLGAHRHSGEPLRSRDFLIIFIWPALVYGSVVFFWLKGLVIAAVLGLVSLFVRHAHGRRRRRP